jgi:hypothetical protein
LPTTGAIAANGPSQDFRARGMALVACRKIIGNDPVRAFRNRLRGPFDAWSISSHDAVEVHRARRKQNEKDAGYHRGGFDALWHQPLHMAPGSSLRGQDQTCEARCMSPILFALLAQEKAASLLIEGTIAASSEASRCDVSAALRIKTSSGLPRDARR